MIEFLGWAGGVLLALCGAPLAINAVLKGKDDTNRVFLWSWYIGEILTISYIHIKHGFDYPLLFNYGMNILFITAILYYNYFNRIKG